MQRTALIFGITGQDGSLLARYLINLGYRVTGVSRSYAPNVKNLDHLGITSDVLLRTATLEEFRSLLQLLDDESPDEIYNLAAQSSVGLSFEQPMETLRSIADGSHNLLDCIRYRKATDCRVYMAGSSECFGQCDTPATESTPLRPLSPYGIAKVTAFHLTRFYREAYGLNACTGLLFNHESSLRASTFVTHKVIRGAIRTAREPDFKLQLGDLSVERDWGWAEEYVVAIHRMLQLEAMEDLIIATGRTVSLQYIVEQTFLRLGLYWQDHCQLDPSLRRPLEIPRSAADPSLAHHRLGWSAQIDIDGVIDRLIEGYQ
jgi:GDPmannose 4,6-dehydratase